MTLRTLTLFKEAKFALVYFAIDQTFSILETRKLQTETRDCAKERGSKVKVKSGKDVYEAEIVELNDRKTVLEESLERLHEDPTYGKFIRETDPNERNGLAEAEMPETGKSRKRAAPKNKPKGKKTKKMKAVFEEKKARMSATQLIFLKECPSISEHQPWKNRLAPLASYDSQLMHGLLVTMKAGSSPEHKNTKNQLELQNKPKQAPVKEASYNPHQSRARRSLVFPPILPMSMTMK